MGSSIKNKLLALNDRNLLRYLLAGGSSYLVEITVLAAFIHLLDIDLKVSVSVSFFVGLAVSFLAQKIYAFKSTSKAKQLLASQATLYLLLVGVNYLFTVWFVLFAHAYIGALAARTIALIITTTWNFFIYKKIIFKN